MTQFPGDLSPFRPGFLRVSLWIAGAWADIPMSELTDDGVSITRGPTGGRLSFSLRDATGKWAPRHPMSPYYGVIGRGTIVRVQVEMTAGTVIDRWRGHVTTWEPRWTTTGSRDSVVAVEAAGAIRRLSQGQSPLRSVIYRALSAIGDNLVAYWPCEDAPDARSYPSYTSTGAPIVITGTAAPAEYAGLACSEPIPTIGDARWSATVPAYVAASPAVAQIRWIGMLPAATPNGAVLMRARATGTLGYVDLSYSTGGALVVTGVRDDGTSTTSGPLGFAVDGKPLRYGIEFAQDGADIDWTLVTLEPNAVAGLAFSGTISACTLGRITSVEINPTRADMGDAALGHLTVEKAITSVFTTSSQLLAAYAGETAAARFTRLCAENGLTSFVTTADPSQPMGAQGTDDLLTLLRQCENTDNGVLYEPKTGTDLGFVPGSALYSQVPDVIPYVENMLLPFAPVEDDAETRNTVTVTRDGGASATVTKTDGPLGTGTVGIYDEAVTLSLADDDDALRQAHWRVNVGTHDESRWPVIGIDLADPRVTSGIRDAVFGIGISSRVLVTGIPAWLPPGDVSVHVTAYTETIRPHSYRLELECVPARPYRVPRWDDADARWSGDAATATALTATQTTFTVVLADGLGWSVADGPYEIVVGGETMLLTDAGSGADWTVVRSTNGVVRAHDAGSPVQLSDAVRWGM